MKPFDQLCLLLRCALGGEPDPARAIAAAGLEEEPLIRLSLQHRVAPFLAGLAADPQLGPLLPGALRICLTLAREANCARNRALLDQLDEVLAALDLADAAPVLLKGIARLVDGTYPDPAARFLQDIDLLVPEDRLEPAAAILARAGYRFSETEGHLPEEHHHLPTLVCEGAPAGVELHRAAVPYWREALLPRRDLLAHAVPVMAGKRQARAPSAVDSLLHLVAHGQIQHRRLLSGGVLLSDVVECVLLARQAGEGALRQAAAQAQARGMALEFGAFLEICDTVAGRPLAAGLPRSAAARLLARRALWQQDRRLATTSGRMLVFLRGTAMTLYRHPSSLRRLPARIRKREFYVNRLDELRRVFSR